jgi:hypothetical protein
VTISIAVRGDAAAAVERVVPELVGDLVASGITAQVPTLWGPEAEPEAARRLGWTEAVAVSAPLVDEIEALRDELLARGLDHVVLAGMGGSSLAPEVIARTSGVELTVVDATHPGQVLRALEDRLERTVLVVSSKSGSTVESDSHRRAWAAAFRDAGLDPADRIVVVTDLGSPLEGLAREAGHRVFLADAHVGGRFSALTAFGMVPAGLAGADVRSLLAEAGAVSVELAQDEVTNPGLVLGAVLAGTTPLRDKIALVADGTHVVGLADWIEQLLAESTGKGGRGLLPVVLGPGGREVTGDLPDVQIIRLVADELETFDVAEDEVEISASLGGHFLLWQYAVAVAGRLLGVDPFDQPDVEAAKAATRELLTGAPGLDDPALLEDGVAVRATGGLRVGGTVRDAVTALLAELPADGYVAIQAYVDRHAHADLLALREWTAERAGRPTTFGWGPRFLHSTGQYHKGGPATGVFLQIVQGTTRDLTVPGAPFTFGELLHAQAAGDAAVLAEHGRPVLTLTVDDPSILLPVLREALG